MTLVSTRDRTAWQILVRQLDQWAYREPNPFVAGWLQAKADAIWSTLYEVKR